MFRIRASIEARAADLRAHPVVGLLLAALAVWIFVRASDRTKAAAYLGACVACVVVADAIAGGRADRKRGATAAAEPRFPVRSPWTEMIVLSALCGLGTFAVLLRTGAFEGAVSGIARGAVLVAGMACLFQIAPLLWLRLRGYGLRDLGARWTGARAGAASALVVAVTALVVAPEDAPIVKLVRAGAWREFALFATVVPQVFAEEFLRMTFQTRIAALTRNAALGWLLASIPWAVLHVPAWVASGDGVEAALGGAARIVPIGLVWGFLTWRTGSLVPAMLAHWLNVWGLQNP